MLHCHHYRYCIRNCIIFDTSTHRIYTKKPTSTQILSRSFSTFYGPGRRITTIDVAPSRAPTRAYALKPQRNRSFALRSFTMSSKLIPANPSDVLVVRDITPNVTTLSVPFLRYGVIYFGGRGTVVRLSSGGVLVFSPVALTPEAEAVVKRLGGSQGVKYIVAGDMEHHIFISEWAKAYPEARIIAPAGLPEKRAATKGKDPKISVDDKFFAVIADGKTPVEPISIAPDFDADFSLVYNDVHPNKEIVLLYKPDRILIEADLLINLPATEQYSRADAASRRSVEKPNLLNRIAYRIMTTNGSPLAGRRFNWYAASAGNRPRFNEAIQLIDTWDFDTLIPCHGDTIVGTGKDAFQKVFAWHLAEKQ